MPLYGALDPAAQDRAIAAAEAGRRKIVLATSIAETSITIEGVRVVIDSGLARVPRFEPDVGITRLETVRVSRASADQRRGRAGRTEPGVCYRLWDEPETQGLVPFAEPEIKSADLSGLLLDCAEWGTNDPRSLAWLDPPAEGVLAAARSGLQDIGALDDEGRITEEGRRLRALPLPPRLARMVLKSGEQGAAATAADLAAILVERGIGGNDADLARSARKLPPRSIAACGKYARAVTAVVTRCRNDSQKRCRRPRRPPRCWRWLIRNVLRRIAASAAAFFWRMAAPAFSMLAHPLAAAPYLVVAELQGRAAATRIVLAVATR